MTEPKFSEKEIFPDVESSSDDYARRFKGPVGEWLLKIQMDATLKLLADIPPSRILDVGGGHGQTLSGLIESGHQVTIFDSDVCCKKRVSPYVDSGQAVFAVGNLLALPYEKEAFDVVISYRMMTHMNQWQKFVKELTRVAKNCVMIDYPSVRSINFFADAMFFLKKRIEKNTRTYTLFSKNKISEEFARNHFKWQNDYPQFFLPMVLHRLLKKPSFSREVEFFFRKTPLTRWLGSPVIARFDRDKGELDGYLKKA